MKRLMRCIRKLRGRWWRSWGCRLGSGVVSERVVESLPGNNNICTVAYSDMSYSRTKVGLYQTRRTEEILTCLLSMTRHGPQIDQGPSRKRTSRDSSLSLPTTTIAPSAHTHPPYLTSPTSPYPPPSALDAPPTSPPPPPHAHVPSTPY